MRSRYWLLVALLFAASPSHADNDSDTFLMNTAIIAAALSWGAAAWLNPDALSAPFHPEGPKHMGVSAGEASQVRTLSIFAGKGFGSALLDRPQWRLSGHWEFELHGWEADRATRRQRRGWFVGLTPVLQYEWKSRWRPYVELGVGIRYLSDVYMADQYKSTRFQFGDLVGIGFGMGAWQIGLRYLHVSNANIETPNPGANFYLLKMDYRF